MVTSVVISGLMIFLTGTVDIPYEPWIDSIVQKVSIDSGFYFVECLSGERSVIIEGKKDSIPVRHSLTGGIMKATKWLKEQFELRGIEAEIQPFDLDNASVNGSRPLPLGVAEDERDKIAKSLECAPEQFILNNVVATIPGEDSQEVVLGAHYDATSEIVGFYTPGADDNASGCAAVLEAARILSAYKWQHTLKFVFFSGEEQGLLGSEYYVQNSIENGESIIASLIMDMIAYDGDDVPQMDLHCCPWNTTSQVMGDTLAALMGTYSLDLEPDIHVVDATDRSDHFWFWQRNIPSVLLIEDFDDFTPFYHTMDDRIGTLDAAFMQDAMRLVIAWTSIEAGLVIDSPTVVHERLSRPENEISLFISSPIVRDRVSFGIRSEEETAVAIFDASGRKVRNLSSLPPSRDTRTIPVDVNDLPSGVYWLNVTAQGRNLAERFVIAR